MSAFGKIAEGLGELVDTAKEKTKAGIETVVEASKDAAETVSEKAAPTLDSIIKAGQDKVRVGQEKAEAVTETGKGILGRMSKAIKAFKE